MTLAADRLEVLAAERSILSDVSVQLEPGKVAAICGSNGAGKSTLLKALAGLRPPAFGSVSLDAKDLTALDRRDRARAIGYLPQGAQPAWNLSVLSLVALGRIPWGDGAGQGSVAEALAAVDLAHLAERPVESLSGGELALAQLARVFAGTPRWLLIDEPLAALDLAHQQQVLALLKGKAAQGCGVAIVLHDLALARNHADRVIVLKEGRLVADDSPARALSTQVIREVWGVEAAWLGEAGAEALVLPPT